MTYSKWRFQNGPAEKQFKKTLDFERTFAIQVIHFNPIKTLQTLHSCPEED